MNLNECKFGDRLRMANGQMAIYLMRDDLNGHSCAVQDYAFLGTAIIMTYNDDGLQNTVFNEYEKYNITGKWEDEA